MGFFFKLISVLYLVILFVLKALQYFGIFFVLTPYRDIPHAVGYPLCT